MGSVVVAHGLQSAGSAAVAHGTSCSTACGIPPDQGPNLCPLHWQADSQPLHHQGSPLMYILVTETTEPQEEAGLGGAELAVSQGQPFLLPLTLRSPGVVYSRKGTPFHPQPQVLTQQNPLRPFPPLLLGRPPGNPSTSSKRPWMGFCMGQCHRHGWPTNQPQCPSPVSGK